MDLWNDILGRNAKYSLIGAVLFFAGFSAAHAESFTLGSESCGGECHQAELDVWSESPHQASFAKFDDPSDELQTKISAILEAVGDDDMTESATCTNCHFTMVQEEAGETGFADSGPSCESCHGSGSEFRDVHSEQDIDYATRMAEAEQLGMVRPHMKFEIAQNCNGCHAMARPEVSGETIDKLISAGHPIKTSFELVRYSQGSVRHRFYEPDTSVNAVMNKKELSNLYVEGQVAQFLAAHNSLNKSINEEYKKAMAKRKQDAAAALSKVSGSDAFTASPTEASARAFVQSAKDKDLSSEVGGMLPDPSSYKE